MAIKSSRGVTSGKGTPQRLEGKNGDMSIRSSTSGKQLFVKDANKWHSVNLDINTLQLKYDINSLQKQVRELLNSTRNNPVIDSVFLKKSGSDSVKLSNDTGNLITTMDGSSGGSFKIVRDVNNGNPVFQMGSADTESFFITANYASGGKGLNSVLFNTKTAQTATGDEGQYDFYVDEVKLLNIDDSGTTAFTPGSVTNDTAALTLENNASASSMTGTGTSILFNQMYHHAETPTIVDAGKIVVRTEGNWTSTGSTQDSEMTFHTVENGTQAERLKISSTGAHTITSQANPQLKILYNANDYATFNVADSGDLTIATVGDGTTDSIISLDADGHIVLNPATNTVYIYSETIGETASMHIADTTGILTISTTASLTATTADLILDSGGNIELDAGNGVFVAKNAGTEFSATDSAYAGMILGYTDIGLDEGRAELSLTTSYVVPTDEFSVAFTSPPSGNVEIEIQIMYEYGSSGLGTLEAGLSSANATSGYAQLEDFHEEQILYRGARSGKDFVRHSWTLTALSGSEEIWVGFKSTTTTGTPKIHWGGNASGHNPSFIMKAIALPSTITT